MGYSKIEESNLWKVLEKQVKNQSSLIEALSNVKYLTDYAAEILNRINETFPNYTWHNPRHALNVVGLMDRLLGDFVETLTSLECAILLISAFMHDVGMAFTPQERESLFEHKDFSKFNDFTKFLEEKPEMHLRYRIGKKMLGMCSPQKRNFSLPARIDRQMRGQGYKSGDYRFIVDEKRVIDLLTGKNLYENPYVFVRESIQNAIDTTRHRIAREEIDPEICPATISY